MPCYATYNISVELTGMHPEILKRAIASLGYEPIETSSGLHFSCQGRDVRIQGGSISLDPSQIGLVNEIKRAYSRQVIQIAAQQYGMELQPLSENQVIVTKRF